MSLRVVKLTLSFLAALLISAVCGTQYLFSAYSTMLAERLDFNSIQINTIGSSANYGAYLGRLFFGYIADNYQERRYRISIHTIERSTSCFTVENVPLIF